MFWIIVSTSITGTWKRSPKENCHLGRQAHLVVLIRFSLPQRKVASRGPHPGFTALLSRGSRKLKLWQFRPLRYDSHRIGLRLSSVAGSPEIMELLFDFGFLSLRKRRILQAALEARRVSQILRQNITYIPYTYCTIHSWYLMIWAIFPSRFGHQGVLILKYPLKDFSHLFSVLTQFRVYGSRSTWLRRL
jgi:hypothetical protein